jgi:hypothetical protein
VLWVVFEISDCEEVCVRPVRKRAACDFVTGLQATKGVLAAAGARGADGCGQRPGCRNSNAASWTFTRSAQHQGVQFRSCVPPGVMICGSSPSTRARNRVLPEVR